MGLLILYWSEIRDIICVLFVKTNKGGDVHEAWQAVQMYY